MDKIKKIKSNIVIKNWVLILLLLITSNISNLINLNLSPNLYIPQEIDTPEYPYVDSACFYSKYEFMQKINKTDQFFETQTEVIFYGNPSSIICHGRPVISNGNDLTPSSELSIVAVGIGVNTLLDSIENLGKFTLLFVFLLFMFNKFKLNKINLRFPQKFTVFCFSIVLIIYGFLVYETAYSALYNILLSAVFGNFLIYLIFYNYNIEVIVKSLVTMSIFPLLFSDSNVSFFWLFLLTSVDLLLQKKVRLNKYIYVSFFVISFSTLSNLHNFIYEKNKYWADWILFTNHRHKGGIADINNGYQSLVFVLDIFVLIIVFYSILFLYNQTKYEQLENDISNSIVAGFVIWFFSYFISQINPSINYLISEILGIPENIDTISSYNEYGINWRGVTPSWELTGIWLLLVFCILSYFIIIETKYIYFPILIINLISINYNTQRTVLILMFLYLVFIFLLKSKNNFNFKIFSIFLIFFVMILQGPAGERLEKRLLAINFNYEISSALRWEIKQSIKRYDQYDLNLQKPDYDFNVIDSYESFFSKELNTDNKLIINSFSFLTKVFGREFQWFRFFYLTELDTQNLIFGHGAGQSHQQLAVLIETPHNLYFTTLFQFGVLGVLYLLLIFFYLVVKFFKSGFEHIYILGIFIFLGGLKTEFIMTHNQIVFFIMFMTFLSFQNKTVVDK